MKIALMSKEFINNDIDFNCEQIISSIKMLAGKADLICFGEAFLQGFDSLSWKYKIDANIALAIDSKPIKRIRKIANEHKIAVAFGYLEKDIDKIYCSYIFIGNDGEIVNNYRRVSKGWKEYSITDKHYCEGKMFNGFNYLDKKFVVALCGDLWYEENILAINNISKDIILWPLFVNYSLETWILEKEEYLKQASKLKAPVLFVNSICQSVRAFGGCYLFSNNKIESTLELGCERTLIVEI